MLVRPGVVGAACRPHRRLPDQAAPSFVMLLRQHAGEGLSLPPGNTAPRGAPGQRPLYRAVIVRMRWHEPTINYVTRRTRQEVFSQVRGTFLMINTQSTHPP